jgi:hypothetical protein
VEHGYRPVVVCPRESKVMEIALGAGGWKGSSPPLIVHLWVSVHGAVCLGHR